MANELSFRRKRALFEGVLAGTLFGTAAVLIRLLKDVDVFSIAFWRLIIAFLVLATTIFFLRKPFGFGLLKEKFCSSSLSGSFIGIALCAFRVGGYGHDYN